MKPRHLPPAAAHARAPILIAALAASLLPFALPAGCSEDTSSSAQGGPTGNPSLRIVSPACGEGGPCCIAIGTDPDAHIPIEVVVDEVLLRPPGVCGTLKQCGHLVLRVNGVENNTGSGTVIDVLMRKLADRYADLTISVSVRSDKGDALLDHSDTPQPVSASISITTRESCSGVGAGGMGGASSAATAGGMTSAGGMGGMSGTGGAGGMGGMSGTGGAGAAGAAGMGGAGGAAGATGMGGAGGAAGAGGLASSGMGGAGGLTSSGMGGAGGMGGTASSGIGGTGG